MIKINSNMDSSMVRRHLSGAASRLEDVFERLASGQRINSASDDAAGLAIASQLNSRSRVYAQGIRNLNDGVSALSIADGALENLTGITTRLMELAEQAGTGTLSGKQRSSLDAEAQALRSEYTRIVQTTTFNGINLFNGSTNGISIQAGYGTSGIINGSVGNGISSGSYTTSTTSNFTATVSQDFDTADFNGDGIVDMAVKTSGGNIIIKIGNGDGTFQAGTTLSPGGTGSLALADINNDGRIDVLANGQAFLGNGNGTFAAALSIGSFSTVADMNGDGIPDLVSMSQSGGNVYVSQAFGNGNGTFQTAVSTVVGGGASVEDIAIGDVDGDGDLDIAVAYWDGADELVSVLRNNGSGGLASAYTNTISGNTNVNIELADLDNDGKADLVYSDGTNFINRQLSTSSGGSTSFGTLASYDLGDTFSTFATGDTNGDGHLDIVISGDFSVSVGTRYNNGAGVFSGTTINAGGGNGNLVTTVDLNNDGIADILAVDPSAGALSRIHSIVSGTKEGVSALATFSLETIGDARQALSSFTKTLNVLTAQRGKLGSSQARFDVASNVLSAQQEQYKAAHSRITDADIAVEAAELTRLRILQQGASAVLAQANQAPALALNLLSNLAPRA